MPLPPPRNPQRQWHEADGCRLTVPPDGRPTVVCLGDSVTYGVGVRPEQSYCSLLNAQRPERWLNMAWPGGGSQRLLNHWSQWSTKHADCSMFVLQTPYYDRQPWPLEPEADGINDDTFLNGFTGRLRDGRLQPHEVAAWARMFVESEAAKLEGLMGVLHVAIAMSRAQRKAREMPVVAIIYPYESAVCKLIDELAGEWWARARQVVERVGAVVVDIPPPSELQSQGLLVPGKMVECHWNAAYHAQVAGRLGELAGKLIC